MIVNHLGQFKIKNVMNRNPYCLIIITLFCCLIFTGKNYAQTDSKVKDAHIQKIEQSNLSDSEKDYWKGEALDTRNTRKDFSSKLDYKVQEEAIQSKRYKINEAHLDRLTTTDMKLVKGEKPKPQGSLLGMKLSSDIISSGLEKIINESVVSRGIPACPEPTSLTSTNISRTTATLGWKSNGNGDAWEVEVVETGVVPSGMGTVVTMNPFTVTGLMPATTYDFYVRELCYDPPAVGGLIITGVLDGPLPQGLPKLIELEAIGDIADLSEFGLGLATNGGGSPGSPEYTFPAISVSNGDVIYVTRDSASFAEYMGFNADFETGSVTGFNGDDAVELYKGGTVVDLFGDPNTDGTGEAWEYLDGWAYRNDFESPNGGSFVSSNWSYSGPNALDGESNNATSNTPFPSASFDPEPSSTSLWTDPGTFTTLAGDVDSCFAGTIGLTELQLVCPGEFAIARTNEDEIFPSGGGYGWLFIEGEGASGGLSGGFSVSDQPTNFVFDNDLNGTLSGVGLPPLLGNWMVRGFSYEDENSIGGTTCGFTGGTANILFRDESACEEACSAGTLFSTATQEICANEFATVSTLGDEVVPAMGGYAFQFVAGADGSGGNGSLHIVTVQDSFITFNNDLNGLLSSNSLPPFSGTWNVYGLAYSDTGNVVSSICDITSDSAVIVFKDSSKCDFSTCAAGSIVSTTPETICPSETFNIATNNEVIPEGGIHSWLLAPGVDGSGGPNDTFSVSGFSTDENFDNDLNGLLSFNSLDPLEGSWTFFSQVSSDTLDVSGSVCDVSTNSKTITFLTSADSACQMEGDTFCLSYVGGPYTDFDAPPCDSNCGTPLSPAFEVWANEAFIVDGTAGSQYTFEFCTGYNETTWAAGIAVAILDTISGEAVEGSLIEYVEDCSVTWDSPFDTTYIIIVSKVGDCGGAYDQTDNGAPTLDCGPNGAICLIEEVDCDIMGPSLSLNNVDSDAILCNGDETGSISVSVTGGIGDVALDWSNGDSGVTIDDLGVGLYTVIATDENGCTDTLMVEVSGPEAIEIVIDSIINPTIDNDDGAAYVSISGGTGTYDVAWSDGSTVEDLVGVGSGIYTITVTDSNDCSETLDVSILDVSCETTDLAFTYSSTPEDCNMNNGTVTINASGGAPPYTYNWPVVISTGNDAMISGVSEGVFILTLSDDNGCSVTDTIAVGGNRPAITVVDVSGVTCADNEDGSIDIDVSNGVPPYTFDWSNEATTEDVSGLSAGIYFVTVTDSVGCDFTKTVAVESVDGIVVNVDSVVSATVGNADGAAFISVSGGTPDYSYVWDGQATENEDLTNASAGDHTVLVIDSNECEAEITVNIPVSESVELLSSINALNVYPNPTRDMVNVYLDLEEMHDVSLNLMSYDGRILEQVLEDKVDVRTYSFDLAKYNSGIYFINILIDGERVTRRVSFIR